MPVDLYCVVAVWRYGGQAVQTHVVQTLDRGEALKTARNMARGNSATHVLQATGDSLTGVWTERVVAEFAAPAAGQLGETAYFKVECREDGDIWSQVDPLEGDGVGPAREPWEADAA